MLVKVINNLVEKVCISQLFFYFYISKWKRRKNSP